MKKNIQIMIIVFIAIIGIGGYLFFTKNSDSVIVSDVVNEQFKFNGKQMSFVIDGRTIQLENGEAETEIAPGSASKIVTKYFGNESFGDIDEDGRTDVAFLVTQNSGGTGTFYYVVVAVQNDTGYRTTNSILLGDRIAPQTIEFKEGEFVINYVTRAPGEPMTANPSIGVSKYIDLISGELKEVSK